MTAEIKGFRPDASQRPHDAEEAGDAAVIIDVAQMREALRSVAEDALGTLQDRSKNWTEAQVMRVISDVMEKIRLHNNYIPPKQAARDYTHGPVENIAVECTVDGKEVKFDFFVYQSGSLGLGASDLRFKELILQEWMKVD